MADTRLNDPNRERPRIIAGKYRLLSVLGSGGMATVWRAEHLQLSALVAVKMIDPNATGGAEALRQCQKEAHAAAALRSPHVVQVMDFGNDDATGSPFIVMELLEGESLADRLARLDKLSPAETSRVLTHVARALGRAHEAGIIHRDLKPANVFLVRNDDEELAKVLDFGIARVQRADAIGGATTQTRGLVGTPFYMSPEHITAQVVDHRTDLWAMAVMAFECMTGRRPFESPDLGQLVLQICSYAIPIPSQSAPVPAGFDAWFARAARREIDQRFQSARELADELRTVCQETARGPLRLPSENRTRAAFTQAPARAAAPAPAHLVTSPRRPRRAAWWLGGITMLAAVAAGVAGTNALVSRAPTSERAPALDVPATHVASPPAPVVPPPAPPPAVPAPVVKEAAAKPARRPLKRRAELERPAPPAPASAKPTATSVESVLDHRR